MEEIKLWSVFVLRLWLVQLRQPGSKRKHRKEVEVLSEWKSTIQVIFKFKKEEGRIRGKSLSEPLTVSGELSLGFREETKKCPSNMESQSRKTVYLSKRGTIYLFFWGHFSSTT